MSAALAWNFSFWISLGAYALACIGAGLLLLRAVAGSAGIDTRKSPFVFLAIAFVVGLGSLGQLWILLALSGQMTRVVVIPLLGVMILAALVSGWRCRSELADGWRSTIHELSQVRPGLLLVLAVALASLAYSFTSLGRELSGDPLALHMMVAKAAAASGTLERFWFQGGNEYFGLIGEITYAVLMQIGNDDAAQMITWVVVFAIAATLVGVCVQVGIGLRGQIVAITALTTSTALLIWVGEGKIDLISTSLALLAIYFVIPRTDLAPLPRGDLMMSGLLAGFAITAKLMLGFCLFVMISILLLWIYLPTAVRSRQTWKEFELRSLAPLILAGLLFGVFAAIGLAPHLIKNGVLLGAPFAPLGTGSTGWLVRELWYDADTVSHIRRLYPFVLTFGEYFAQYGLLSVLVLAFLPLALFLPRPASFWASPLTAITVAAWLAIAGWATFQGDKVVMRYILPALLLCIPLAAAAAERATAREFRPRAVGLLVVGACLATLYMTASYVTGFYFFPSQTLKVVRGAAGPCERGLYFCSTMEMINQVAKPGARVLSILSYKYYLRPDLFQCSYDHRSVLLPGSTAEERWRWFYSQGYSFILPDPSLNPATLLKDIENPPPWITITRLQAENPRGPIQISYDLSKGGPTAPPPVTCRETRQNAWKIVSTGP